MMILAASMSMGKVAPVHDLNKNFRRTLDNVDPSLTKDNIVYIDNLHGRSIEEYTNEEMQMYIDEYNAKQKRKDRKINGTYIDYHTQDQNMMKGLEEDEKPEWAYEFVLCYGNHEDYWHEYFNTETPESRKREMYDQADREYQHMIEQFKRKYPHLEIAYAALHADEPNGSIHLHLCVQPRANEYARGVKTRVSISKALEQDGFEYIHSASAAKEKGGFQMERLFKDFRHNVMNPRLENMGHEIKKEEHGNKHYDCATYKHIMSEADNARKEATQKVNALNILEEELKEIDRIENLEPVDLSKVQKVQVKTGGVFSKTEERWQMDDDTYEYMRRSIDTKTLNRATHEKIKKQREVFEKYLDFSMTPKEKELKQEVMELRKEVKEKTKQLEEAEIKISQKNELIEKLKNIIDIAKEFIRNHGMTHIFSKFLEEKEIEKGEREQ